MSFFGERGCFFFFLMNIVKSVILHLGLNHVWLPALENVLVLHCAGTEILLNCESTSFFGMATICS